MEKQSRNVVEALIDAIKQDYDNLPDFLDSPSKIMDHCRFFFEGRIFVSHTAADSDWCRANVVSVVEQRFGPFSYFFLSLATGDPRIVNAYRFMVEYSMNYAKTVIIALSERSVVSAWATLEAQWAVRQGHPLIVCRMDDTRPSRLSAAFSPYRLFLSRKTPRKVIDFRSTGPARDQLNESLAEPPFKVDRAI
jgi:hypothetical protein